MLKLTLSIVLMYTLSLSAQINMSQNDRADIAMLIKDQQQQNQKTSDGRYELLPINTILGTDYLSLIIKVNSNFNPDDLNQLGTLIGARINDIVSIKYPVQALAQIEQINGIDLLQVAGKVKPLLDRVRFDTKVDSVHLGLGLPEAYTGKDVLIGITDWGFDYSSPMFYDTLLQNTRIFAAWDQFKTSGPTPANFAYGTEYNTATDLITAGTDTANIYSFATHGSHVAGIAGGSGAGTDYRGIAFESQYLFATFLIDESAVLDAWQWMFDKATTEGKRLVINMSWGLYHTGALDGTSLLSQAMDDYSNQGVIFVTSGGNNGNVNFHIKKEFNADTLLTRVIFYNSNTLASLWGQSIHAWGEPGKTFSSGLRVLNLSNQIDIESPWYSTLTTSNYVDTFLVTTNNDTIWYNLSMDAAYPTNNRPQMRLRIKKLPLGYKLALKSAADDGIVHYWNVTELTTDVGNWGMDFSTLGADYTAGDNNYGIGAPACTNSAITVAAHTSSFLTQSGSLVGGAAASFSSVGPMMNDNLKPDISAPGVSVASSINSYTDNAFTQVDVVHFNGRDYPFARFSGTSMSSPAVAGIVALMLEANPYLSPAQVKKIIIETAREDNHTGSISNTGDYKWGWGKINALAAIQRAINTVGYTPHTSEINWSVYPNPSVNQINLKGNNVINSVSRIEIINFNGQICHTVQAADQIDVSHLSNGTYIIRLVYPNKVEQQQFIIAR